ncbi:MAG TPA: response regulator [Gemmatimonadales bacterium]
MPAPFDPGSADRSAVADLLAPAVERDGDGITRADVVLVEDDATLVEMLTYTLTNRGYACTAVAVGPDALERVKQLAPGRQAPVVLLNLDLPGLSRVGAIEQLERARPEGFRMIALTRTGSEREHVRALSAGAVDYVVKPISLMVLAAKIIRLLWDHDRR